MGLCQVARESAQISQGANAGEKEQMSALGVHVLLTPPTVGCPKDAHCMRRLSHQLGCSGAGTGTGFGTGTGTGMGDVEISSTHIHRVSDGVQFSLGSPGSPGTFGTLGTLGTPGVTGQKKPKSEVKKCRKVYGIEHREQWCLQCRYRYIYPLSLIRNGLSSCVDI